MSTPQGLIEKSFVLFLRLLWKSLGLPPPTRAQVALANCLQFGGSRLQLQAFRGIGKSWITAAFCLWILFNDKDKKILVVSGSKQRADDFSMFCMQCITTVPWLQHMQPLDDNARWSRISFDVRGAKPDQAPSVKSVGITGQITGSRADIIIPDDVETPENSATDIQREKLLQLVSEFESVLKPLLTSRIIFLGTPQSIFTISKTLAERGYRPVVWPSRYPRNQKELSHYGETLAPELVQDIEKHGLEKLAWKPTDTRFSSVVLEEKAVSMGMSNYMLQFQLDTTLSDALKFPLKLEDIPAMPLDAEKGPSSIVWGPSKSTLLNEPAVALPGDRWYAPASVGEFLPWQETIVAVDPSGRGKDETVAMVLSQINGLMFLRGIYTSTDGYSDDTLLSILRMGQKLGASTCVVESNFGDGTVTELMKRVAVEYGIRMGFEEVRASAQKEKRILAALEPILQQHRLIIDQRLIEWDYGSNPEAPLEVRFPKMLMYQLTRMCDEKGAVKFDDRADCLALGVKWFADSYAISAKVQNERREKKHFGNLISALRNDPQRALDRLILRKGRLEGLDDLAKAGGVLPMRKPGRRR